MNRISIILEHLKNAGYKVYYDILKARDFGIPQNRERLFIVGFLDQNVKFNFPSPIGGSTKVGQILESTPDNSYTISNKLWEGHQRRKIQNKLNGKGFGYGLFDVTSPYTNTLSARYYKDGSEILIKQHGKNPRKITPREAARLQGFPDSFKIPVSDTQAYKQFGNSVCVPVIEAIAKEMKKALLQNYQMRRKAPSFRAGFYGASDNPDFNLCHDLVKGFVWATLAKELLDE